MDKDRQRITEKRSSNSKIRKVPDEVLQRIGEILFLSRSEEIEVGYVFGSSLRGEFEDVDVALLLSKSFSSYESMKFAMRIGRVLEKAFDHRFEFDVKILNLSPIYFQHEVIKNGKPVFCRDVKGKIRYEARVLSEYLDYRDILEWFNQELLARA
jgi:hypothetical protein